jgi:spermidine/putrescine transport system permease protein
MDRLTRFPRTIVIFVCAWLALFMLFPNLLVLAASFLTRSEETYIALPLSLDGYLRLAEPLYWEVMWHSAWLAFAATAIALLVGFPFAYAISQLPERLRNIALFLVIVPFWTNSLIRTYAIKTILGKKGLLNETLLALGIIDTPLNMMYTEFAVIFGLVYIFFPFMVLPLYSSIEKLDRRLLEAARDLGASRLQTFTHVIIPLTLPGIVAGSLIVFLPSMGCFYVSDVLGGAGNLLLGNIIKTQFLNARDWPFGSALSMALVVMMTGMMVLYFWANKRVNKSGGLHDSAF